MRGFAFLSAILVLFMAFDMAVAKPRGVKPGSEAERWAAVGILKVSGGGWCSAALLDQKTVLTAAHCVYNGRGRQIADPAAVEFHAGWRDGITAAKRRAVRIIAHRGYDPLKPYDTPNIATDLAIVILDSPIDVAAARAYGKMDKVRIGEPLAVVSFSGQRSDVASIMEDCPVIRRLGDILMLGCESHPGMSGAPVFTFVNGKPRIVALISGNQIDPRTGKNTGLALAVDAPLGRVTVDANLTKSTPTDALPYWTARNSAPRVQAATAERKSVRVGVRSGLSSLANGGPGAGLSGLTGSGSARTVIRPPSN